MANQAKKRFGGAPPPLEVGAIQGEHGDQVDVWTYVDAGETSPIRVTIDQPEGGRPLGRAEAWLSIDLAQDLITLLQAAIARAKSS